LKSIDDYAAGAQLKPPGRMYEVNINADPAHFLDWDKPLSQMPSEVQQKLKDAWLAHPEGHSHQRGQEIWGATNRDAGYDANKAMLSLREAGIPGIRYFDQGSRVSPMTGIQRQQLQARADTLRQDIANSEITGLGQIDKMRGQLANLEHEISALPTPTSNFVVFDDALIDILRKYGIAGIPAAGVAGAAMQNQEAQ
jgi:hypothetical protein